MYNYKRRVKIKTLEDKLKFYIQLSDKSLTYLLLHTTLQETIISQYPSQLPTATDQQLTQLSQATISSQRQ